MYKIFLMLFVVVLGSCGSPSTLSVDVQDDVYTAPRVLPPPPPSPPDGEPTDPYLNPLPGHPYLPQVSVNTQHLCFWVGIDQENKTQKLVIKNTTNTDLVISSIEIVDGDGAFGFGGKQYFFVTYDIFNMKLPAKSCFDMDVGFILDERIRTGNLVITLNNGMQFIVTLGGKLFINF